MPKKSGIGRRSKGKMMGTSSYKRKKSSPPPKSNKKKKEGYILPKNVMTDHKLTQYIGQDLIEMGSIKVI